MKEVHILHESYYNRKCEALLFPLIYNRRRLLDYNISLHFYSRIVPSLMECDVLCISNGFFKFWWRESGGVEIISFLEKARKGARKIVWFDTSDSTGTTQFKVLPYVYYYMKNQVLKDRSAYQKTYHGLRIFTDFYHKRFGVQDHDPGEPHLNHIPADADLKKIGVGWNYGMAHYGYHGITLGRIWHRIRVLPLFYPKRWYFPSLDRPIPCSCRIGTAYSRETIAFSRKEIKRLLREKVSMDRVSKREYFEELTKSIAVISPFGSGEVCYRDFESVICGAAMVKQDMRHLETWPNLWIENKTYLPVSWDFSDFEEKIESIHSFPEKMVELAHNAQRIYKNLLCTEEGHQEFCERFAGIISQFA